MPHKILECIGGFIIYLASTYKWMMLYLQELHLTIDGWREGIEKNLYKTKSKPRVYMKVWEWEHKNWFEEKKLEALSLDMYETALEWINLPPKLIEDIVALTSPTEMENPTVTRCRALESMTAFYLFGDSSGQGFGSGL